MANSLFTISLNFIVSRLSLIDSLVDFPDTIGLEIFRAALAQDKFLHLKNSQLTRRSLQIFFLAYGDFGILESVSLKESQLFLNDVVDTCWWLFEHINYLDLSHCGLGDDHDILPLLMRGLKLKTLILQNNSLSDEGVRKLTVQPRMFKKVSSLSCLDLSDNEVLTERSIKLLKCLSNLSLLKMSNTAFVSEAKNVSNDWLVSTDLCSCIIRSFNVKTSGWAAEVIDKWKAEYHQPKTKLKGILSSADGSDILKNIHSFYSKRKVKKEAPSNTVKCRAEPLVLVAVSFSCPHREVSLPSIKNASVRSLPVVVGTCLFKTPGNKDETSGNSSHGKVPSSTDGYSVESEDWLLSQYRTSPPSKKRQKLSLRQLDM